MPGNFTKASTVTIEKKINVLEFANQRTINLIALRSTILFRSQITSSLKHQEI